MVSITFTGDIAFSGKYQKLTPERIMKRIDKRLIDFFNESDYVVGNIEGPITSSVPQRVGGTIVTNPVWSAQCFPQLRINVWNLGNNHIMDHGSLGLIETLAHAQEHKCYTVGAGINEHEATKPVFLKKDDECIAVYSISHSEGILSGKDKAGVASHQHVADVVRSAKLNRRRGSKAVLVYHGGEEFTHLPTPKRKKFIDKLSKSFDAVVCHHSHTVQPWMEINGTPVFYGLGNFIIDLDGHSHYQGTDSSLIVRLNFNDAKLSVRCLGTYMDKSKAIKLWEKKRVTQLKKSRISRAEWEKESVRYFMNRWCRFCTNNDADGGRLSACQWNMKIRRKVKESKWCCLCTFINPKKLFSLFRALMHRDVRPMLIACMAYLMKKVARIK